MTHIFLILVFTSYQGTVNITTPMPDMVTCEKVAEYHMKELPRDPSFTVRGISKPIEYHCKSF